MTTEPSINLDIHEALGKVIDPETGCNIVALGLIYNVQSDAGDASITMTFTSRGCPLMDVMVNAVKSAVGNVAGVYNVHVDVVWNPAWSPERMSDALKERFEMQ